MKTLKTLTDTIEFYIGTSAPPDFILLSNPHAPIARYKNNSRNSYTVWLPEPTLSMTPTAFMAYYSLGLIETNVTTSCTQTFLDHLQDHINSHPLD